MCRCSTPATHHKHQLRASAPGSSTNPNSALAFDRHDDLAVGRLFLALLERLLLRFLLRLREADAVDALILADCERATGVLGRDDDLRVLRVALVQRLDLGLAGARLGDRRGEMAR